MSALFNFESLLLVILLLICTCTYLHAQIPAVMDRNKHGYVDGESALMAGCLESSGSLRGLGRGLVPTCRYAVLLWRYESSSFADSENRYPCSRGDIGVLCVKMYKPFDITKQESRHLEFVGGQELGSRGEVYQSLDIQLGLIEKLYFLRFHISCQPILPFLSLLEQIKHLLVAIAVIREEIIKVLLKAVIIQLPSLLDDLGNHLLNLGQTVFISIRRLVLLPCFE
jgi:Protein of unknown function (DUF1242)